MIVYGLKTKSPMNGQYCWRAYFTERDQAQLICNQENGRHKTGGCQVYKTTTEQLEQSQTRYIVYNWATEYDRQVEA